MVAAGSSRTPSLAVLIPSRGGSTRIKGKNIRVLAGHPLIAYTIAAALESGVGSAVIVSTDSEEIADVARYYGAEVPCLRPAEYAGARSPDIEWVEHMLSHLRDASRDYDCFSILRPTSPFRRAETISKAWEAFLAETGVDSLRAVEKCRQHPGKMWMIRGKRMSPLLPLGPPEQPWHSSQYHALPEVYVQNASLEIAWTRVVFEGRTIAGDILTPFVSTGFDGFDLNDPEDWIVAEHFIATGEATLPTVTTAPYRNHIPVHEAERL